MTGSRASPGLLPDGRQTREMSPPAMDDWFAANTFDAREFDDLDGLLAVLAPGAWGDFDAGPGRKPVGVIHGALRVARRLLHYWGPGTTLVTHPIAGQPALLGFTGRELSGVLIFTVAGDKIQAVHVIGDPRKLSAIGAQLA